MTKYKQVSLNVDELKGFMTHIIANNRYIQDQKKVPVAVEIEGLAGIGKTSAIKQLGEELGLPLVRLNLAQVEELGDIVGFPLRQFQMCRKAVVVKPGVLPSGATPVETLTLKHDECEWIDEHAVADYSKLGYTFTGENRMSYCPPEWISGIEKGGILLLDDYTRADTRFLQACMTLIETQEYISWKLPKDWHIVLTSNPDNGDYLVNVMDTAQKTRFISVNLKFDVDCWARWAESVGIDGRCINFLLMHPELVNEKINARSITTFFNAISSIKDFSAQLPLIQMIGEGSVGVEFSTMFTLFINNKLDKLVSPLIMLTYKEWDKLKAKLIDTIGVGNGYRADIAAVLTTRLMNYTQVYCKDNPITKLITDRIASFAIEDIFADDLKYALVKSILNSDNKAKFNTLMLNAKILAMSVK